MTLQIFDFLCPIPFYLYRCKLCITTTFHQSEGQRPRDKPDLAEVKGLHVEGCVHAAVAEHDGRVHLVVQLVAGDDLLQAVQDLLTEKMGNSH